MFDNNHDSEPSSECRQYLVLKLGGWYNRWWWGKAGCVVCGVWCVVCGVNLPFWLKFKWRMAHSRNRGTWNREPPSPLSIRGLVVYSISPIHLFFNSIPSLPPPLRATSRQYHTFHSPIHPHFHLCNLPASSTSPQHPTLHSPSIRTSPSCATTAA